LTTDVVTPGSIDAQRRQAEVLADRVARRSAIVDRTGVLLPFVVIFILAVILVPDFLSGANIRSVLVNASIVAIVGYGMTLAIAIRGLDLSVGAVAALSSVVTAGTINSVGAPLGVVTGLLIGLVVGLINGLLVAFLRIPAFVATLATMGVARGAALLYSHGNRITISGTGFRKLATGSLLGVPGPFLLAVLLCAFTFVLLERTGFGRHACAVGGNPAAAREAGLNERRLTIVVFGLSGLAAGIAGVLITSQLGSVDATPIQGLELQAIAIAVLGGTSLAGGSGNLPGTFIGALLLAMISASLNLRNIPGYYQYLALGTLLLLALGLDTLRQSVRSRLMAGGPA
jgi:ribose/xylose/arabinose/galactoside ABC-type transport system permease subunit